MRNAFCWMQRRQFPAGGATLSRCCRRRRVRSSVSRSRSLHRGGQLLAPSREELRLIHAEYRDRFAVSPIDRQDVVRLDAAGLDGDLLGAIAATGELDLHAVLIG